MAKAGMAPLLLVALLLARPAFAQDTAHPPCNNAPPFPTYGTVEEPPSVGVWSLEPFDDPGLPHVQLRSDETLDAWPAPACTDWPPLPFMVALAGRFRHAGSIEPLLARLGAMGEFGKVRYWAAARQQWEALFDRAYAVADAEGRQQREDFRPEEMPPGRSLHVYQDPGGLVGGAVYRMRIDEAGPDRLTVELENVSSARVAGLFPLPPGTLRFLHVIERQPGTEDLWGLYSLMGLAIAPESARTYVNRTAAIFRHIAGIPPEQQPPVWP